MAFNEELLESSIEFMNIIASQFSFEKKEFILVSHILPTAVHMTDVLSRYGKIAGVVPKTSSLHRDTLDVLQSKGINVLDIKKQDFFRPNFIQEKIKPILSSDRKQIIIDIGGYFASNLRELNNLPGLLGIVEDTENGLQKYERALKGFPDNQVPVMSIARSRVKDFEDYLIGRTIAQSTLDILKKNKIDYSNFNFGIVGFGEVGRGAALYLKSFQKLKTTVHDYNPQVQQQARAREFPTTTKSNLLATSDVLVCATGNKSISDVDLQFVKPGCYISSCTSREDEFDFRELDVRQGEAVGSKITSVAGINLINEGNAVNFLFPRRQNDMVFPYIYLTLSSLIECAVHIEKGINLRPDMVNSLDPAREQEIISGFRKTIRVESKPNANVDFIAKIHRAGLGR